MSSDPLGALLLIAAPMGIAGVFALALVERLVPVLPSPGLLAAIGIAAAEGHWWLPAALVASVLGSGTGALVAYILGLAIGAGGSRRFRWVLHRRDRWGRYLRGLRRAGPALPFVAQLLPASRLLAPLLAGAMPHDRRRLAIGTVAGLTVWNVTFIGLGYALERLGGPANATAISVAILGLFGCLALLRLALRRRAAS